MIRRLAAIAVVVAIARPAMAADKLACIAASDRGQHLRREGKLLEARDEFEGCADAGCPGAVRDACTTWIAELRRSIPTIVASARGEDPCHHVDLVDVRVSIDGTLRAQAIDGRPIELDLGPHEVTFESSGWKTTTIKVPAVEGEKDHPVQASLPWAQGCPEAPALPDHGSTRGATHGSPRVGAWVASGFALVGWGMFAGFGIAGAVDYGNLKGSCGSNCAPPQTSNIQTDFWVADIALGVAIVGSITAAILFLIPHHDRVTASSIFSPIRF